MNTIERDIQYSHSSLTLEIKAILRIKLNLNKV